MNKKQISCRTVMIRLTAFLLMLMMLPVTAAADPVALPFADVPADAWYYDSVAEAYAMGILNGVSMERYSPDSSLTVAECIKLASCISQVKTQGKVTLVNGTEHWYEPYVQYALGRGIIRSRYTDYNVKATRAQVAVMFSRILDRNDSAINRTTRRYSDVYDGELWYYEGVYRMYRYGIMIGSDNGKFRPDDNISRGEIAAVAVRMLNSEKRVKGEVSLAWEVKVPILMYHNFAEESGDYTITADIFRSHLEMFRKEGYTAVTFEDLIRYADGVDNLPEKPILLTSDDGYMGVLEIALPLLEEYDMKMSVAVIGNMIGLREDGKLSHFTLEEEAKRDSENRIELISHSNALHNITAERKGAYNYQMSEKAYADLIHQDCDTMKRLAGSVNESMKKVFVYPYGSCSRESEALLRKEGYSVTVTTSWGTAVIAPGWTLEMLPRITAEWYKTGDALLYAMKYKKS